MSNEVVTRSAADIARDAVNRPTPPPPQGVATRPPTTIQSLKRMLSAPDIKDKFSNVLNKQAPQFIQTLLSTCASMDNLEGTEPLSIVNAALQAAAMNLPVNPNLGYAWIVPYKVKGANGQKVKKAQFQIGYLGFVQLAIRSGEYRTINYCIVYDGMLIKNDIVTGEVVVDGNKKESDEVIGYCAYIETVRGYRKFLYMTKKEVDRHARLHSKTYNNENSQWKTSFDSMALKTVLKLLLKRWGILSTELHNATQFDGAVVKDTEYGPTAEYVDSSEIDSAPLAPDAEPSGPISTKDPETPAPAAESTKEAVKTDAKPKATTRKKTPEPEKTPADSGAEQTDPQQQAEKVLVGRVTEQINKVKDVKLFEGIQKSIDLLVNEGQISVDASGKLLGLIETRRIEIQTAK